MMNGLKKNTNFQFSRRQRRETLMTLGPYVKTVKYVEDDLYDFGVGFPYSL